MMSAPSLRSAIGGPTGGCSDLSGGLRLPQGFEAGVFVLDQGFHVSQHCLDLIGWKFARPVLVHMDDLSRMYIHAGYCDRDVDRLDRHGTMASRSATEHVLKFEGANGIDIARWTISDQANTPNGSHGRYHDLAHQSGLGGELWGEFLLHDENRGLR